VTNLPLGAVNGIGSRLHHPATWSHPPDLPDPM